jgi:acyl-CoA synthetase (AMP-forming)/AMP-acid ligase II
MKNLVLHIQELLQEGSRQWWFPAENRRLETTELWHIAGRYAGAMRARHGIGPGDRVLLVMENGSAYVELLLAIWRLGAVAIPVRPYGGKHFWFEDYLADIVRIADYRLVVYEQDIAAFDSAEVHQAIKRPVLTPEVLLAAAPESFDGVASNHAGEHAVIQFTSGSTGQPKGVIVTHGMMMTQLAQLDENQRHARGGPGVERALSWLPFYHDMGLFIGVLLPLYSHAHGGAAPTSYFMRNPARWFQHLSDWRADLSFITSSVLATSLRTLGKLRSDTCSLERLHVYVAAEKVNAEVLRTGMRVFSGFNMPPTQWHIGYGMAEYALGCTHSPHGTPRTLWLEKGADGGHVVHDTRPGDEAVELVSVGIPNTGCRISIHGADGNLLPDGQVGEIRVAGPCVSPGYLNNPVATAEKLAGGCLRTGDLGLLHQDELYFLARQDDLLVVGGRNVIPSDVETLIESLPSVGPGRSLLFGIEHPATGIVELTMLVEISAHLQAAVRAELEATIRMMSVEEAGLLLKRVVFVAKGSIEKTSSGKKRSKVIRQRYLDGILEEVEAHAESVSLS